MMVGYSQPKLCMRFLLGEIGRRPTGIPRHRREYNIKMNTRDTVRAWISGCEIYSAITGNLLVSSKETLRHGDVYLAERSVLLIWQ
jgi:hypothetical protein